MVAILFYTTTGAIHLTAALAAMLLGAAVLLMNKGTLQHKRVGYGYVAATIVVNVTAFLIYGLFSKFGPFHIAALFSGMSILGGMIPVIFRRYVNSWRHFHYYFMNWSVVGLYAAFWAETLVRLFPMKQFWPVVILATGLTTFVGSYLINRYKTKLLNVNGEKITPSSFV